MSLEILEAKEAIREVIDRFSNLECDVHAQMPFFTEDTHVMVYMGGNLAMDIHGREELEKTFSGFTSGIKSSHHMNGQQVITVTGDTAVDEHYCRAALVTEEDGRDIVSDNYIRYRDTLVRQGGESRSGFSISLSRRSRRWHKPFQSPRFRFSFSAFLFSGATSFQHRSLTKSRQENLFRRYARIGRE